ncbi:stage V sporulation protein AD [Heyndrickxia oleronia]|uniref:Stage V sporulation protein AD n=1 Tax=Heyndrickxia oleronia TaxID=38875 RepID=A0A8E2I8K6_9BACI|nr:stage V sporulation protein AD [Heyndrickxia oleronia]OJH17688.1 stage V sporulation protein AD [Bacillus obstructivus]MDH5160928.1 stage V sporulation protein AD [Heyndrickxia oleronia]MEC1372876.1 stage V sporulation protein AD [Heyndrickxia oleronia]OOP68612.1 stage V sporulation protein AD [Heyndrickxia oleronia]QQZ03471.1 stage V sporulation protein AD [Heyndrickxia oleronia]
MLKGSQTWVFEQHPAIISTGVVGGPFEKNGNIAEDFDKFHDDLWMGQDSYEKAQKVLIEDAVEVLLKKIGIKEEEIRFFLAGDLINQITPSSFAARTNQIPNLGLFSACATSMEGLALSAFLINYKGADKIITGASSHNASAEKQFRYPTEYGGQKPPTAQWTVTGAGFALVASGENLQKPHPRITSATIGKVIDMGISDPFNMGGAMAPAAVDTIERHLQDLNIEPQFYDLIITGDLATIGRNIALDLFQQKGLPIDESFFNDCGLLIYNKNQPVLAGASGPGCSATVLYGHLLNQMRKGVYKRILVVATGALLSPLSFQQNETIPCIAHAVSIEYM